MRLVTVVGTRPQLIKAAALLPPSGPGMPSCSSTPASTGTRRWPAPSSGSCDLPQPDHSLGVGGGTHGAADGADARAPRAVLFRPSAGRGHRLRRHELHARRCARGGQAGHPGRPRRGRASAASTGGCPRSSTGSSPTTSRRGCSRRRDAAVANLAAEGMRRRRDPRGRPHAGPRGARRSARSGTRRPSLGIGAALGLPLRAGGYVFATVHRAENRQPDALRAWTAILGAAAAARPVVLALHPGTAASLAEAGVAMPAGVHVVAPQGYRTTLALQLHAAAVLTDSGGIQRESAWLGVPCLVLRDRTEWVEAVERSEGRMVVVGLDLERTADAAGPAGGSRRCAGTRRGAREIARPPTRWRRRRDRPGPRRSSPGRRTAPDGLRQGTGCQPSGESWWSSPSAMSYQQPARRSVPARSRDRIHGNVSRLTSDCSTDRCSSARWARAGSVQSAGSRSSARSRSPCVQDADEVRARERRPFAQRRRDAATSAVAHHDDRGHAQLEDGVLERGARRVAARVGRVHGDEPADVADDEQLAGQRSRTPPPGPDRESEQPMSIVLGRWPRSTSCWYRSRSCW